MTLTGPGLSERELPLPTSCQPCSLLSVQPGEVLPCREDGNSQALSGCASRRLLTLRHLPEPGLPSSLCVCTGVLVLVSACTPTHSGASGRISLPGKPATSPELVLRDGPLSLRSAQPLVSCSSGNLASAATARCSPGPEGSSQTLHLSWTRPVTVTSILPGPSIPLGPPRQDPHSSWHCLVKCRCDHVTPLLTQNSRKCNITVLEGRPVVARGEG